MLTVIPLADASKLVYMELRDRVKKARNEAGLTQEQLAAAAKVSRSAVTMWERGQTKSLDAAPCVRAAHALNVDPLWLASGEGHGPSYFVKDELYTVPTELTRAWQKLDKHAREHLLALAIALAERKK